MVAGADCARREAGHRSVTATPSGGRLRSARKEPVSQASKPQTGLHAPDSGRARPRPGSSGPGPPRAH